ncbi:hypothetical protein [Allorhodopirellula heiligendammensis]|uniref:Uncharacterized protein n=1 Tax=Allorhodopirellula heiligendammensis TaxID=2714739 RepID=A0A5C6BUY2_9BACT|nr:hypothetical protein [Allorhodopirellula heiligendammensis]TWU15457.1 hypothetical protein Poly21_26530 [Allorhodopirellula heiligendammensis]
MLPRLLDAFIVLDVFTEPKLSIKCAFTVIALATITECSRGHDARPAKTDELLRVCQYLSYDYYRERGESPQTLRDLQDYVAQTEWELPKLLTPNTYEHGIRMLHSGRDAWDRPIAVRRLNIPGRPMAWVSAGDDGVFGTDDDREREMMWTYLSDNED